MVAEAGLAGSDNCLCAVGDVQFGEDVGDVVAYRLGADDEVAGNVAVVSSFGDHVQHFPLPLGQLGERVGGRGGEEVDEPSRDGGAEYSLAAADGLDGADDVGRRGALEQVA